MLAALLVVSIPLVCGFTVNDVGNSLSRITKPTAEETAVKENVDDRREFLLRTSSWLLGGVASGGTLFFHPTSVSASVYLDPAMYGDQELRVSAVDSLRESVRRAILQNPTLAPSFYKLAVLDGLSFDAKTNEGGPDGRIIRAVLEAKEDDPYTEDLKKAALTLIDSAKKLKRLSSITIADAVALGGAEAIESIGGPAPTVQLGRMDAPISSSLSPLRLDLLSGRAPASEVLQAFKDAGLTEREMTAILGGLLTVNEIEKGRAPGDWKKSTRGKFREPGKIGRMSEFKRLTDEDIREMEDDDDDELMEGDEDVYIAETFGARDQVFGQKVGNTGKEDFNRYVKKLYKGGEGDSFGWIGAVLLDKNTPTAQAWLSKYAQSTLNFQKDFTIAYNSITQLGAVYTGGKYESLLKDKPRKRLNDY